MTAKELTFETLRYFQIKAGDPGVVLAKIEMGSLASKAGLKPYEIMTHVNSQPVSTPMAFEEAVATGGELKFSVSRMTQNRVVKIDVSTPEEPAGEDEAAETAEEAGVEGEAVPVEAE